MWTADALFRIALARALVYAVAMSDRVDAGFQPEALDPALAAARDRLTKVVADVERIRAGLEPQLDLMRQRLDKALEDPTAITDEVLNANINRQLVWLESYAKISLTFTKVVDESSRLRSFLAGGADSRPDLSSLSDTELRKLIKSAVTKTAAEPGQ